MELSYVLRIGPLRSLNEGGTDAFLDVPGALPVSMPLMLATKFREKLLAQLSFALISSSDQAQD